jgi:hypothetical protein
MTNNGDARRGRDEGMERADRAAHNEYKQAWMDALERVCLQKMMFLTDDIHALMRDEFPDVATHEYRVVGPLMQKAVRLGICDLTMIFRPGRARASHLSNQRVYRSRMFDGASR